jgi:hypothetical protein
MKTLPASYYDCRTLAERAAWLQEENRRRCEEAGARREKDPAADLSDLTFAVVPAEEPAVDLEWDLDPSRVGR